ncbi:MAG: zf-HC2 domain-containing protein [Acidobacteriota bacterium]
MFWNHVSKILSSYIHGELPPEEARRVGQHLSVCQRCRAEFEEIKFGAQMMAHLAREQAPESLWNGLELAIQGKIHRKGVENAKAARRGYLFGIPAFGFAAALLLISVVGFWFYRQQTQPELGDMPSWEVTRLEGKPAIGRQKMGEKGQLAVGQWLVTDSASRAQISVGQIGEVKVEPNSRIRLVEARGDEHRLALVRGKMEAFIWAPPRQFFVDTPSAVAVDLGCSYTLEVSEDGQGMLHVTMGWVAFEWKGVESFVPAGAMCVTRPGFGPGTPYFSDASMDFQTALARFDVAGTDTTALASVLSGARERDALTLWHLLARTREGERNSVYDRLAELIPPPPNVTREGVLNGDRAMLDAWWDKLGLGDTDWWRMWKGPLPAEAK